MADNNFSDEIRELREDNLRLRQQRDAANAMVDFLMEELVNLNEGPTDESR